MSLDNAQSMPVVGALPTIIVPAVQTRNLDTQNMPLIERIGWARSGALVVSASVPVNVWLCTGLLTVPGTWTVPPGSKLWLVSIMGTMRIVTPDDIQSVGFDAPASQGQAVHSHVSYWLEDHAPPASRPWAFGAGG